MSIETSIPSVNTPPPAPSSSSNTVSGKEEASGGPQSQPQLKLVDIEITDQNVALNLMIGFLTLAQKKGAYTLQESSKIWECIQTFTNNQTRTSCSAHFGKHDGASPRGVIGLALMLQRFIGCVKCVSDHCALAGQTNRCDQ